MTGGPLAALRARLDALAERADAGPLLDDRAARQSRALVAALPPEGGAGGAAPATLEALRVAALVHWNRHCLRGAEPGPGDEDEDLTAAVALFSRIHRHDPLAVPEPLLPLIDTSGDPGQAPDRVTWEGMAEPYLDRYETAQDPADLRRAVQLLSAALDAAPEASPDRPRIFHRLSAALLWLYKDTGDEQALTACLDTARAETRLTRAAEGAGVWSTLLVALLTRFDSRGEPAVLDEAVQAARRSAGLLPESAAERASGLNLLGILLYRTFSRTRDQGALSEALGFLREAIALTPAGTPEHAERLRFLSHTLLDTYRRIGDPALLPEAIRVAREAAGPIARADADRRDVLDILAAALLERFHRTGDREALAEMVFVRRRVLTHLQPGSTGHPAAAAQLGAALWLHHRHTGDSADLEEALGYGRQAVRSTPEDDPDLPGRMSNLAAMLRARFLERGVPEDLDEAVALLRAAVAALPHDHPGRAAQLTNLGNALRSRYELTGDPAALAEAAAAAGAAVEETPVGHPDRPAHLGNLGAILRARFVHGGPPEDLDEAVALLRAAVAALPHDHPGRAVQLTNLGNALRLRHDRAHDPRDAGDGLKALWAAAAGPAAAPLVRMRAAWAYGDAARWDGDTEEALKGFTLAVELLPRIAPPSLGRDDREHRLGRLAGLGSEAAAVALDAGLPGLALELLEQARGILLGEVLTARGEVEELAEREPALHAEFGRLRDALSVPEADTDTRLSAGTRLEETIARVRGLPGFGHFLRPPTVEDLRPEAGQGPVVVLNVTAHRSDAIILDAQPHTGLRVVRLPGLTPEAVAAHADGFADLAGFLPRTRGEVAHTLGWLWDAAVGPVLEALGITGPPAAGEAWPRVWWCPVGPLASLPLHAAGRHGRGGDSALDRVVSSYTPTVQALAASRRRAARDLRDLASRRGGALVVAMPDTPGTGPLPYAGREAEFLVGIMPDATLLTGTQARRDVVLAEIGRHPVAHFACHGVTDWRDSSASRLILADGDLSVRDLLRHRLDGTRLVVLSACSTSVAGGGPSDEAVHLTSTFLAAGATQVVGTLWAVEDRVAAQAATTLYTSLTAEGTRPPLTGATALALHAATRRLREQYPGRPGLWAPFVHVGV